MDLKNLVYENDKTLYTILSEIVRNCGIESVLISLSEIVEEEYLQKISYPDICNVDRTETLTTIVDVHGRKYVKTN